MIDSVIMTLQAIAVLWVGLGLLVNMAALLRSERYRKDFGYTWRCEFSKYSGFAVVVMVFRVLVAVIFFPKVDRNYL